MKPLAVFTIVQNESRFLPVWLRCYTQQVPVEDIYVLDHQTTGDAADVLVEACQAARVENVLPVTHEHSFDSFWLTHITRYFQQFLLMSYRAVLFTAADELLLPRNRDLLGYAAKMGSDEIRAGTGIEVVHKRDSEAPIDWTQPLVAQRSSCYTCYRYSKPVLATTPVYWSAGWYQATNYPLKREPDPNLVLLHLHRIDYDYCLLSHREKTARTWKPDERNEGVFRHNLVEEPEQLSRWLLCHADEQSSYAKLSEIPSELKEFC